MSFTVLIGMLLLCLAGGFSGGFMLKKTIDDRSEAVVKLEQSHEELARSEANREAERLNSRSRIDGLNHYATVVRNDAPVAAAAAAATERVRLSADSIAAAARAPTASPQDLAIAELAGLLRSGAGLVAECRAGLVEAGAAREALSGPEGARGDR